MILLNDNKCICNIKKKMSYLQSLITVRINHKSIREHAIGHMTAIEVRYESCKSSVSKAGNWIDG